MARPRTVLPFEHDGSARFLPGIIALMVWLAGLALAASLLVENTLAGWRGEFTGALTVQVPAGDDSAARIQAALNVLRHFPGVGEARALDENVSRALLEPWLGRDSAILTLPLPRLIDVTSRPGATIDRAALARALADAAPGAELEDHATWLDDLLNLGRTIEITALAVVAVIALAATAAVGFTVRAGLALHERTIELLHQMGAPDRYVAREFQFHALKLGLRGAALGALGCAATLLALEHASAGLAGGLLPSLSLRALDWAILTSVPLVAAAMAALTARATVLRSLARLP